MLTLMLISYLQQPKSIDESLQTQCAFVKLVSCLSRYFSSNWHKPASDEEAEAGWLYD